MIQSDDDEDDLWRLKMGRVSEWDARFAERLFSFHKPKSAFLSTRALAWRTRHVDSGWRLNGGPQVIVKAAGSRKSRSGVRACVRYVARLRACDQWPARAYDEFGRELSPQAVLNAVNAWQLESDADNLSAMARKAGSEVLGERKRLCNIQAWHFVFCITVDEGEDEKAREALVRAGRSTIDAIFTRFGYRVIWALHTDTPGRPHIHAVVKAVSELGGRLRCDIHGDLFDSMRCEFAAALAMVGLSFQAARREDRAEIRHRIMTGQEPLRPARRKGRGDGDLARRAPVWFRQFGKAYVEQLRGGHDEVPLAPRRHRWWQRAAVAPTADPPVPPALNDAYAAFTAIYRDPYRAFTAWQWLAIEGAQRRRNGEAVFPNRRLAEWCARRRPETFGGLLPGASAGEHLRMILRQVSLPVPTRTLVAQPNPALGLELARLRWRRRVERDRKQVADSLVRLARVALDRTGNEHLAWRVLRRLDAGLNLPVGEMPVRPPDILKPYLASAVQGSDSPPILQVSVAPAMATSPIRRPLISVTDPAEIPLSENPLGHPAVRGRGRPAGRGR